MRNYVESAAVKKAYTVEGVERDKERINQFTTLHKVTYLVQYSSRSRPLEREDLAGKQALCYMGEGRGQLAHFFNFLSSSRRKCKKVVRVFNFKSINGKFLQAKRI